jgi:flagellar hook assembly protein FlgD
VLSQNFPNPFNPTTEIRYGLPKQSRVTLTIYNALGQEVAQLADEIQDAGYHQMRWNGTNRSGLPVSTGVYFYRLRAEGFVDIKKMLLVK